LVSDAQREDDSTTERDSFEREQILTMFLENRKERLVELMDRDGEQHSYPANQARDQGVNVATRKWQ
jgi:hypothetical protein